MELFKVSCVTCRANLSVRNESLIGQIVACPRCGSMVEVQPPTVAEPAVVESAPAPGEAPPNPEAPSVAESTTESVPPTEDVAQAVEADAVATTATTAASYKLIAWSLSGLLLGAAVVGWILLASDEPKADVVALAPSEVAESTEIQPPVVPAPTEPQPLDDIAADSEPQTEPQSAVPETEPQPTPKDVPPQPEEQEVSAVEKEKPLEQVPVEPVLEESPQPTRRFNPLDFDPANLTINTLDQATEQEPTETTAPPTIAIAEQSTEEPEVVPSTTPAVRQSSANNSQANSRDAAKQLALVFPNVKIEQMPVVDCLRLFSHLSGVSISVSPEHLLMAGITPRHKVTLAAAEISLGDMLSQVLEPLRLEYKTEGSQVKVLRQESTKRREIGYPIDDLVNASTSAEQLSDWIRQLVAPNSWKTTGGQGTISATPESLKIEQTQQVQYRVLIFLERLRLARNLPPQSRYPVKKLAGTSPNVQLSEQLATNTTFTFSQFAALDDVFVYWQGKLDVPLLIDWPALANLDLGPDSTIACAIENQPWNTALERVLEPLGLGWRAATGGAIEITSAEKVQTELQLELYPLHQDGGLDPQQLIAQLQKLATQQNPSNSGAILYDPTGNLLLSLQPAATQRLLFKKLQRQQHLQLAKQP